LSATGQVNWAVSLQAAEDSRYVSAIDAAGDRIALAGLEHTGLTGLGNEGAFTVLDANGTDLLTFRYSFQQRQTWPKAVLLGPEGSLCAGGDQWQGEDNAFAAGWAACFDGAGALLWERSLDAPVEAMRRIDDTTIDVFSISAWTSLQLSNGAVGERRETALPVGNADVLLSGSHALVFYYVPPAAHVVDASGAVVWSKDEMLGRELVGMTPSGTIYLWDYAEDHPEHELLYRYESGIASEADAPSEPLLAPTFDISDAATSAACRGYCGEAAAAGCGVVRGAPFWSMQECVTACLRPTQCQAEFAAVAECLVDRGSLFCTNGGTVSGCDDETAAFADCDVPVAPAP
jgi:hypothetical protein